MTRGLRDVLGKFGRFAVVGAVGVLVNTSVLAALHGQLGVPLVIAGPAAFEAAVIGNFLGNNRWTFDRHDVSFQRFLRFQAVSLGGLALATGTLLLFVGALRFHYLVANLFGIGVALLWNFGANATWTWEQWS